MFRSKLLITGVAFAFLPWSTVAKRPDPKPVTPVVSGGIRYTAEGDGIDQFVAAADASSGKQLWKVKIFHNHIKLWLEEDVQWVFITDLRLVGNSLLVRDEKSRCYSVDLARKDVKKQRCGGDFSE